MSTGLQELSVPVPLTRLDEKSPSKAGPTGRIDRILNYIANKFRPQDGANMQLDKRPGWHSLSNTLFDPYGNNFNGVSPGVLPEAMTAGKLGETNFIVGFDGVPYVYSPAVNAWGKFYNSTVLTNQVSQSLVKMDTGLIKCPDSASVGPTHCYVWQDKLTGIPWITFLDDNGATIRAPFNPIGSAGRVKVRSDGTNFWVVHDGSGSILDVTVYGPDGLVLGGTTGVRQLDVASNPWDIIVDLSVAAGLFLVRGHNSAGATIALSHVTYASGTTTVVSDALGAVTGSDPPPENGIAFLEPAHNGSLYIQRTKDLSTSREVLVFKSDSIASLTFTYHTISVPDDLFNICNLTGYVDNVTGNVYSAATILPVGSSSATPNKMINIRTVFGFGTTSFNYQGPFTARSVGLASRQFVVGETPCVMAYYTSVSTSVAEISGFVTQGNPTFYLLRADNGAVVGRLFPGQAAGNNLWDTWGASFFPVDSFQLPSIRPAGDGIAVALPITGERNVKRVSDRDGFFFTDVFSSSVGIRNLYLSNVGGKCVECQNETLIPGPLPRSFDGVDFGSAGCEIFPEQPAVVDNATVGPYRNGDLRSYVIVWERFNRSGNKVRSPSSISVNYQCAFTGPRSALLTIPTHRTTTHTDWICSIYRTLFQGGQEGTIHYKITSDQVPLFNNTSVDTITFLDSVDDASAALNEILYGGSGSIPTALGGGDGQDVDHECAPAFNSGVVFGSRAFLTGYDNSVWFSLPGVAGNSLSFSSGFKMTMPTEDTLTAIDFIDSRLMLFCNRSIWINNQDNYLDSTGSGDIPTPLQLPISNGCTGVECLYRDGIIYASSAGGFYLLTRDLDSQYIGGAIEDDVNANLPILDIVADDSQRIYCLLSSGQLAVYDIVSLSWYVWNFTSAFGSSLTTVSGHVAACCTDGKVRVSAPGSYDDDGTAIVSSVGIADISVAGLPGCQMIWQIIIMGVNYSEHTLTVDYTPDGLTGEIEVFGPIDPLDFGVGVGDEYRAWIDPERMETSSFRLDISDALAAPGRGLSIQQLGLSVGIIPGVRRASVNSTATPR